MKTALLGFGTLFLILGLFAFLITWLVGVPNAFQAMDAAQYSATPDPDSIAFITNTRRSSAGDHVLGNLIPLLYFLTICSILAVWGYHVAQVDHWSPIVGYIICGGIIAPMIYLVGWTLLHEFRYQLAIERVRLPQPGEPIYYRVVAARPYLMSLFL
ncbi:MAG: hypothetical protein CMJ49_00960 [Planctomycetaceae bacterium]|nr:hypothetical protein [Planctomycetaceae bacterium]